LTSPAFLSSSYPSSTLLFSLGLVLTCQPEYVLLIRECFQDFEMHYTYKQHLSSTSYMEDAKANTKPAFSIFKAIHCSARRIPEITGLTAMK
jgi:hypothetical protein